MKRFLGQILFVDLEKRILKLPIFKHKDNKFSGSGAYHEVSDYTLKILQCCFHEFYKEYERLNKKLL